MMSLSGRGPEWKPIRLEASRSGARGGTKAWVGEGRHDY